MFQSLKFRLRVLPVITIDTCLINFKNSNSAKVVRRNIIFQFYTLFEFMQFSMEQQTAFHHSQNNQQDNKHFATFISCIISSLNKFIIHDLWLQIFPKLCNSRQWFFKSYIFLTYLHWSSLPFTLWLCFRVDGFSTVTLFFVSCTQFSNLIYFGDT